MSGSLHWGDILTIIVYFIIIIGIGIWSSFKNRGSVDGFFIARRSIHFIPVGASLFASCIGTSLFIGLSGSAASSGIAVAGFELNAVFVLMLLGWVFVPVYIRAGVYTMPEYIKKRFGGERIRIFLSILSLVLNLFIRITVSLIFFCFVTKMNRNCLYFRLIYSVEPYSYECILTLIFTWRLVSFLLSQQCLQSAVEHQLLFGPILCKRYSCYLVH